MANYTAASRTNYFRVTDETEYENLFKGLYGNQDDIEDYTYTDNSGVIWHGFGAYSSIDYVDPDSEDAEDDFDGFLDRLQKILPDDEAFILFEVGHENLRYITGLVLVMTSKQIEHVNLANWGIAKTKELLGDDFDTQIYN